MGTYIYYHQPDTEKVEDTNSWMKEAAVMEGKPHPLIGLWANEDIEVEKAKGDQGYPDFMEYGHGSYKLSGSCEEDREFDIVTRVLAEGIEKHGLVVDVPNNADDYLDRELIERLIPWRSFCSKKAAATRQYNRETAAYENALKLARERYSSGVYYADSWSGDKNCIAFLFGCTTTPRFMHLLYDLKGNWSLRSDGALVPDGWYERLYKDEKGRAYMLIPQMRLDPDGKDEILEFFSQAWEMGSRLQPVAAAIGIYGMRLDIEKITIPETLELSCKGRHTRDGQKLYIEQGVYKIDSSNSHSYSGWDYSFEEDRLVPVHEVVHPVTLVREHWSRLEDCPKFKLSARAWAWILDRHLGYFLESGRKACHPEKTAKKKAASTP